MQTDVTGPDVTRTEDTVTGATDEQTHAARQQQLRANE